MDRKPLSVHELTLYIKRLVERDEVLSGVWVKGELSNFKAHTSGHLYFTLKDETSQLKCVMFKGNAMKLGFRPDSGMQVLLFGSVSVYERDGAYQMYAVNMEPAGVGALALQYEQLKNRLEAEGLFDKRLKRPLPLMPKRVGLITAMTGAAIRDLISVSTRRFPGIRLLIAPALVQGAEAPASLMRALMLVAAQPEVDVIIMGRGGGSLEDLWAFNNEELARAIRA
ncbi:MAG: exodeoxyribonuclease VII large subunit, partial [Mycobacterium leprae]